MTRKEWKDSMKNIGRNVASVWGAEYLDCEILENGNIRFYCVEDGEQFCSDLTPEELQEYNY